MEQTSETTETQREVAVSRTLPKPLQEVWDVLMTDEGAEALLGPGAHFGAKGYTWQSHDGREGVIRSFHPKEQIRFSWRMKNMAAPTLVSVDLNGVDDGTELAITHSQLAADADRAWLAERWDAVLERIESALL